MQYIYGTYMRNYVQNYLICLFGYVGVWNGIVYVHIFKFENM